MRWPWLGCLLLALWDGGATAREPPLTALLLQSAESGSRAALAAATDPDRAKLKLDLIARAVQRRVESSPPGASRVSALNAVVFDELGFSREVDDAGLTYALLPNVLETRRGNCVGLGAMYLALAELLHWRAEGILRPGHFYVQIADPQRMRNVELLRRGEEMPDEWYRTRFPASERASAYGRPLTASELTAVLAYNVGNELRARQRLLAARGFYDEARELFPSFAEAHANAGLVAHLLGALDDAHAAYVMACRANPALAGLTRNIELLDRETAVRGTAPRGAPETSAHDLRTGFRGDLAECDSD
jgi:regulator of sirC expression with transglutaminase-like and TPR domain